jgi:hypothetical protein
MKCVDGALTDTVGRSERRCDRGEGLELGRRYGETITGQRMIVGVGKGSGSGVAMYVEGVRHPSF